jgi:hypothetical protein
MVSYRWEIVAALVLAVAAATAYTGAFGHDFVNYDDPQYVAKNPYVTHGLSRSGWTWAWTTSLGGNWHPLTWLSWQADVELCGMRPAVFHRTNIFLHAANTMLLFWALWSLSGARWQSALVAAFFGLHPLHVESVAWISERKDVLSTFFGLAALVAYASFARRPSVWRYLFVAGFFVLSLLSKAMLVTLPCVLVLLDFWPLARWRPEEAASSRRRRGRLVLEKAPLLALAAAACVFTLYAQKNVGAVASSQSLTLSDRLANSVVSYTTYLRKTVWPLDLALPYPHLHGRLSAWHVACSGLVLAAVTLLAVRSRRRAPYFAVGWFWYLGTLVPVIGLVQVGEQALADRYTYFPLVGVFIAAVWGAADAAVYWRLPCAFALR